MTDEPLLTPQEVVDLIKAETGSIMSARTFRSYAYRGQAPGAVKMVGRTALYDREQILDWAHNRPGSGARTDLQPNSTAGEPTARPAERKASEARSGADPKPPTKLPSHQPRRSARK